MQTELRIETTVLPGNRVEVVAPQLPEGTAVEVTVVPKPASRRQSMLDYLRSLPPGPLVFKTPAEVDKYIQEERNAWDR